MSNVKSLDDLLNSSVDDLVDMKEFKPLPVGVYTMVYSDWEKTEVPAGVRMSFRIQDVIELENPELEAEIDKEVPFKQLFVFFTADGGDNSMGQGQLKKIVNEVLKEKYGGETLMETLDAAKGAEVVLTLNQRRDKKDAEKIYNGIKLIMNAE